MRAAQDFKDYELLDSSNGEKLERFGNIVLIRPDPQAVGTDRANNPLWNNADAVYHRSEKGGGYWEILKKVPDVWNISYNGLTFRLKPMGFKHTGLFPEQAVNWKLVEEIITKANRPLKVLNLFTCSNLPKS
jgi:23S rRNA (cytosine1962-C5)-methyltransferase